MKKINLKLSFSQALHYAYVFILILGLVVLVFVSYFLYNNFYRTIVDLGDVLILRGEVNGDNLNLQEFNEVVEKIKSKISTD